ncbi:MAG: hypothetical protein HC781_15700, partial [Leptolyngbyaceae cyanobacterium CSU_1_4]|nr:hypothetical protein [Leptolyngbyaceae cyanobacterium CSU_1_4]
FRAIALNVVALAEAIACATLPLSAQLTNCTLYIAIATSPNRIATQHIAVVTRSVVIVGQCITIVT